jgi:hypothetical protein
MIEALFGKLCAEVRLLGTCNLRGSQRSCFSIQDEVIECLKGSVYRHRMEGLEQFEKTYKKLPEPQQRSTIQHHLKEVNRWPIAIPLCT